jgi:GxxExxY protein
MTSSKQSSYIVKRFSIRGPKKIHHGVTEGTEKKRGKKVMLVLEELTGEICAAAIEVHRHLGPGLLESAYEQCLCHELSTRGIGFQRQVPLPVVYKNVSLDCGYQMDILVEDQVVLELKSVERIEPVHEAQLLTYLKLGQKRVGLLLNFNVKLMKEGILRRVL